MKTLNEITGSTCHDKIKNVNFQETCQITDTKKERQQFWNDNIDRMDDARLVKET